MTVSSGPPLMVKPSSLMDSTSPPMQDPLTAQSFLPPGVCRIQTKGGLSPKESEETSALRGRNLKLRSHQKH
ncbi:hypothetical protein EYF80_012441 [Liparis tanakae]|uniref:Uncharacterized protein n=1 Tax=Liparis tanakae TaxID=230148 RepID=A0A4Z2IHS3_9TELE|nr:hypothetical protein EYF80_012441 [Liparis tanakae]